MNKTKKRPNSTTLILLALSLSLIGIFFISISSLSEADSTVGDKFFFLRKQAIGLGLGCLFYLIASRFQLKVAQNHARFIYFGSIFLLLLVFIPQISPPILGARRWINLFGLTLQPSEVVKIGLIIYFASVFASPEGRSLKNLLLFLAPPFLLVILQPNLSTAILLGTIVITLFFLSGGPILPLLGLCSGLIALSLGLIFTSSYRLSRFQALIHPQEETTSSSYHTNQIILALASGGITGKGLANSEQKYRYLPKISTDSILAVIAEETGFIGVTFIITLYLLLIARIFKIASTVPDLFASLIVYGIGCWIGFQALINFSAIAAIIPLTGVPLPFISYGGSSLISLFVALGIIHHIEINYTPDILKQ